MKKKGLGKGKKGLGKRSGATSRIEKGKAPVKRSDGDEV